MIRKITPDAFQMYLQARKQAVTSDTVKTYQITRDNDGNIAWIETYHDTGKTWFNYPAMMIQTPVIITKWA